MLSPIQLNHCIVFELHLVINPEFNTGAQKKEAYDIKLNWAFPEDKVEQNFNALLTITMTPEQDNRGCRYSQIHVACGGQYSLLAAITADRYDYVKGSSMGMLYSWLRGYLSTVSALFNGGPVVLPGVDIGSLLKQTKVVPGESVVQGPPSQGARTKTKPGRRPPPKQ